MSIKQKALTYLQTPNTRKSAKYIKKPLLGEMTDSRTGAENMQNEPGHLIALGSKEVLKTTQRQEHVKGTQEPMERIPYGQS